jgi:predicted RNA-binding Zn-ribbon protein involved in translation (DUF1610 family)
VATPSKNNAANRGKSVSMFCPSCQEKMEIVVAYGFTERGKFAQCSKCGFLRKYQNGDYKKYQRGDE